MRKGKDSDLEPDQYLCLKDTDPESQKHAGIADPGPQHWEKVNFSIVAKKSSRKSIF
jgi:hypothetical protein